MSATCAIIAGAGAFPRHAAREAKRRGLSVVAFGLQGWADPALAGDVDRYEEIDIGQLGGLIERLKTHRIRQAIMAGKVTKGILLDPRVRFDAEALKVLSTVKDASVNSVLGAIGQRLAAEGITLLDSSIFLRDCLCPAGVLTAQRPSPSEESDIQVGVQAARQLAALDIGQTVVVKARVIVAVEALEGTDAAIRRAASLAGAGTVVVKTASPTQDMRFDLPVLGRQTIVVARETGVRVIAVEAGKTLLLDREALIAQANEASLCLVGIEPAA